MVSTEQPIIKWIEYYLPSQALTNEELSLAFPYWSPQKIKDKTGIEVRYTASENVCASDLAYEAAVKLFENKICVKEEIDFLLFCTQTPDYFLPTSACILQKRLGLPTHCGALDFNLGCSGYVYGLGLAKGLIESGQATNVLLLTADTYSKLLNPEDISKRTIFGDGGSATLVGRSEIVDLNKPYIGRPIFGTDGSGADNLIVKSGGMRFRADDSQQNKFLHINNEKILSFVLNNVPNVMDEILIRERMNIKDIDLFVFHQANKYILDQLREKMNIPEHKFYIALEKCGNTVSSSIPIALRSAFDEKKITGKEAVMIIGFGVGYSWAGTVIRPLKD